MTLLLFFTDKITKTVCTSISSQTPMSPLPSHKTALENLAHFHSLHYVPLTEIVHNLKTTTCCLDTLTTKFFEGVFNRAASDVLGGSPIRIFWGRSPVNKSGITIFCKGAHFRQQAGKIVSVIPSVSIGMMYGPSYCFKTQGWSEGPLPDWQPGGNGTHLRPYNKQNLLSGVEIL